MAVLVYWSVIFRAFSAGVFPVHTAFGSSGSSKDTGCARARMGSMLKKWKVSTKKYSEFVNFQNSWFPGKILQTKFWTSHEVGQPRILEIFGRVGGWELEGCEGLKSWNLPPVSNPRVDPFNQANFSGKKMQFQPKSGENLPQMEIKPSGSLTSWGSGSRLVFI